MLKLYVGCETGNKTYALIVGSTDKEVEISTYRDGGKQYIAAMQIPQAMFVKCFKRKATEEEIEQFLAEHRKVLEKYGV